MRDMVLASVYMVIALLAPSFAQDHNKRLSPIELSRAHEVHQRLFNGRWRQDLVERANREGNVELVREAPMPFFDTDGKLPSIETTIRNSTCSADAVIVVSILSATPLLSEDRTSVFTDYLTKVESVLRDNPLDPIHEGDELVVARWGGSLELPSGKRITTRDMGAPPLLPANRYVLLVNYVTLSREYKSSGANDAFVVAADQRVRSLDTGRHSDAPLPTLLALPGVIGAAGCKEAR